MERGSGRGVKRGVRIGALRGERPARCSDDDAGRGDKVYVMVATAAVLVALETIGLMGGA